jgi:hypothetical protein
MDSWSITFIELYFPLVLAACCGVVTCLPFRGERRTLGKLKPFGDFVEYHVEISNRLLLRSSLLLGLFASLSWYLFYDYSGFFPREYKMEVFFDERGIVQSLALLSQQERESLDIPPSTQKYQEQYFQQVDSEIQHSLGSHSSFFSLRDGYVHSAGRAQIVADKTRGWQNYYVKSADGELTHILEVPNKSPQPVYTRFEKLPSKDDYIRLSLTDLLVRHHIMLRTQYKQALVQNNLSDEFVFKFTVVGITKVTVFPWPSVSNTIYLADFGNSGLVPIAYAIYR